MWKSISRPSSVHGLFPCFILYLAWLFVFMLIASVLLNYWYFCPVIWFFAIVFSLHCCCHSSPVVPIESRIEPFSLPLIFHSLYIFSHFILIFFPYSCFIEFFTPPFQLQIIHKIFFSVSLLRLCLVWKLRSMLRRHPTRRHSRIRLNYRQNWC